MFLIIHLSTAARFGSRIWRGNFFPDVLILISYRLQVYHPYTPLRLHRSIFNYNSIYVVRLGTGKEVEVM